METRTIGEFVAGGIDQRYYPEPNKASNILNFRYDPNGGWRNDRGWEPLIPYSELQVSSSLGTLNDLFAPCRFLQVIQRHQGAEEYYVQERNGNLFYEFGNEGSASTRKYVLATDRNLPKPSDPGTQAIPYGRFTLFMNGYNDMIKWWGREKVNQFSFYQLPPSPTILPVDTAYNKGDLQPGQLPSGSFGNTQTFGTCIQFLPSSSLGLGDPAPGAKSTYSYRISYVTDTGSESPLSGIATISWETLPYADPENPTDAEIASQKKYGVFLTGLDPGHDGVVARRIYRTKNKKNGNDGAGDIFYFVAQIDENTSTIYVDSTPDNQLAIEAPPVTDSVVINTSYKYGAALNGSMWIAGGEGQPTLVRYSKPGLPEQFGGFDFFDVGTTVGGHITALYPYYNNLLVFRERAIDVIFYTQNGLYTCTTVSKEVGTIATNSIKNIPGLGVMFINKDGFWLISGGFAGGSQIRIDNMSGMLESEMARLSKNALARATAAYSEREKEYWCHYPVDGRTENSRGASFNLTNQSWSFRGLKEEKSNPEYRWTFSQIAVDQSGYFILGTIPYTSNKSGDPEDWLGYPGIGLQVWSAARNWGSEFTITNLGQGIYIITQTKVPVGICLWESVWYDFGDDSIKKRINTVELESISEGSRDSGITLYWSSDWDWEENSAGKVAPLVGEIAYTTSDQWSFQSNTGATSTPSPGRPAFWNASGATGRWEDGRITRLRWDTRTGLVSWFKFKLETEESAFGSPIIQITKFQINYIPGTVKTINTRMPGA